MTIGHGVQSHVDILTFNDLDFGLKHKCANISLTVDLSQFLYAEDKGKSFWHYDLCSWTTLKSQIKSKMYNVIYLHTIYDDS